MNSLAMHIIFLFWISLASAKTYIIETESKEQSGKDYAPCHFLIKTCGGRSSQAGFGQKHSIPKAIKKPKKGRKNHIVNKATGVTGNDYCMYLIQTCGPPENAGRSSQAGFGQK